MNTRHATRTRLSSWPAGRSPMALARGLLGALGTKKATNRMKGVPKGPALLAVVGGLGAAGATAFKRRRSNQAHSEAPTGGQTVTSPDESG